MHRPLLLGLALAGTLSACAAKGPAAAPAPAPTGAAAMATPTKAAPRSTADLLLGADLAATGVNNVWEGISRLRPKFLNTRTISGGRSGSAAPQVIINDVTRAMDDLRILPPAQVDFVRYYDVDEANGRFGVAAPVIYVVTSGHRARFPLKR